MVRAIALFAFVFAAGCSAPDWRVAPPRQINYWGNYELHTHSPSEAVYYVRSPAEWWHVVDRVAETGYGTVVIAAPIDFGEEQPLFPLDGRFVITSNCECELTIRHPLQFVDGEIYKFLRTESKR